MTVELKEAEIKLKRPAWITFYALWLGLCALCLISLGFLTGMILPTFLIAGLIYFLARGLWQLKKWAKGSMIFLHGMKLFLNIFLFDKIMHSFSYGYGNIIVWGPYSVGGGMFMFSAESQRLFLVLFVNVAISICILYWFKGDAATNWVGFKYFESAVDGLLTDPLCLRGVNRKTVPNRLSKVAETHPNEFPIRTNPDAIKPK